MERRYLAVALIILSIVFISCNIKNIREVNSMNRSAFSRTLEREILKMVEIEKIRGKNRLSKICNVIITQDSENHENCIVIITLGTHAVQNTIKFIPPSDSLNAQTNSRKDYIGYTFLGNQLVVCALRSDKCYHMFIDKRRLMSLQDSIPGYPDALKIVGGSTHDAPTRVYKVINKDSLLLIKSAFI